VKTTIKRAPKEQSVSDLPLFSWPSVVIQPRARAGQFVASRFGVAAGLADTIADLAGLGREAS
jgi:hypothetical protein